MKRRSYHTLVKDLIRLGLCPDHILSLIPRANRYRWMNEQPSKYFGRDEDELDKYIELQKVIQLHPGRFFAYGRFIATLNKICSKSEDFHQTLKDHKDKVIATIVSSRKSIPFSRALKFFQISKNTFYNWKNSYSLSPTQICKKLHHHQLDKDEINKMEKLLVDPRFFHWGISSIHQWAKRNGVLYVSLNSWYKYNKLFGWRNLKKRFRKQTTPH